MPPMNWLPCIIRFPSWLDSGRGSGSYYARLPNVVRSILSPGWRRSFRNRCGGGTTSEAFRIAEKNTFPDADEAYQRIPRSIIRRVANVNAPEVAQEVAEAKV